MRVRNLVTAHRHALTIVTALACLMAGAVARTASQNPRAAPGPTFEVVSIKRNTGGSYQMSLRQTPGGGYTLVNGTVQMLIGSAYAGQLSLSDAIGLPDWTRSEHYDVTAKASLAGTPTAEDRRAMMRALLADRLKFAAHTEIREQPAFDLVLARSDGRLGPGLTRSDVDCAARAAAQTAAAEAARAAGTPLPAPRPYTPPAPGSPVPPCSSRSSGNVAEGDFTMAGLAGLVRTMAGRTVVDKTGLTGYYHFKLEVSRMFQAASPDPSPAGPDEPPTIFVALPQQLGLKLESSRAPVEVLVIDHIERPSEN